MMICTYSFVEEKKNERISYGIKAKNHEGQEISYFSDVFSNREEAEELVRLCNEGELRSCHLEDVILDAIG